jgi:ABC-2 type transport system permease protein
MTIFKHELRQGRTAFAVWTAGVGAMLAACLILFPEMKGEMEQVGQMFGSMGAFTAAFGMDKLDFGTLVGYYAIECGNVLGLGGAFYAAITGAGILSREEQNRTAEFLLTHPVTRKRVLTEKLLSVLARIAAFNLVITALALGCMAVIGEPVPWTEFLLLHGAYFLLQLELACLCFGISAFLVRGSLGAGLGLALGMYCLNLVANIAKPAEFLRCLTPFAYCEGADIVSELALDPALLALGLLYSAAALAAGYRHYCGKDIQ